MFFFCFFLFHLLNLFNNLFQLYLCGIGGTGAKDLQRKLLQHCHEGGPVNLVHSVRMDEENRFQPADVSEGSNIYKVIILDIISEAD